MSRFVKVATTSEIPDQSGKAVEVEGKIIAVFRLGDSFYAIDDTCTHAEGPLSEGYVEGDEVECPLHGSHFNLKTGEAVEPPAYESVSTYPVRVTGEDVEVEI